MKKIYTLFIALLAFNMAFAQIDLMAYGIQKPDTNNEISNTYNDSLILLLANVGDTINGMDSLVLNITINNLGLNPIVFPSSPSTVLPPMYALALALTGLDLSTFNITDGSDFDICYTISYGADANTANNSYCHTYTEEADAPPAAIWDVNASNLNFYVYENSIIMSNNNITNIEVMNNNGQLVFKKTQNNDEKVDLSHLETGLYIIRVSNESGSLANTQKVILQ